MLWFAFEIFIICVFFSLLAICVYICFREVNVGFKERELKARESVLNCKVLLQEIRNNDDYLLANGQMTETEYNKRRAKWPLVELESE